MSVDLDEQSRLREARNKFFPEWWLYETESKSNANARPYYRVVCTTFAECELAREAKPDFVLADVIFEPDEENRAIAADFAKAAEAAGKGHLSEGRAVHGAVERLPVELRPLSSRK